MASFISLVNAIWQGLKILKEIIATLTRWQDRKREKSIEEQINEEDKALRDGDVPRRDSSR